MHSYEQKKYFLCVLYKGTFSSFQRINYENVSRCSVSFFHQMIDLTSQNVKYTIGQIKCCNAQLSN